jgi:hypothetical protein
MKLEGLYHSLVMMLVKGQMQEEGTHEELMKLEGLYHSLVMRLVKGRCRRREHKRSS